jgi:hypothetical protein
MIILTVEIWEEEDSVMTKVFTPVTRASEREAQAAEAIVKAITEVIPPGSIGSKVLYDKSIIKPVPGGEPELQ